MTRISTNVASLRGLRNLNRANDLLGTSLTRLSTGLKINSGKDDPAGLIASETLRSQIATIDQSIRNSNRANNVISTADSALGEIGGLLNQIRGLVQEGLNDGALSQSEIEANQLQIDAALSAINRIAANTTFAGDKLIDGSKAFTTQTTVADAAKISDFQINEALFGNNSTIEIAATINAAAEKGELRYAGGELTEAATLEIAGSKGNQVLFLGGSSTVTNMKDAVNSVTDVTGVEADIMAGLAIKEDAVAGTLTVDSTAANSDVTFTDARATEDDGHNDTLGGSIEVEFVDPGGNDEDLEISVTDDGSGNKTITVSLATDGGGDITSTAADIAAAIEAHAEASGLVTAEAEGDGTGVVEAAAAAELTGGLDSGSINFSDLRELGSEGALSVVFADPGGNNEPLDISVSDDGSGNQTITVSLATDGSGEITSTLQEILDAIEADDDASELVGVTIEGDETRLATAQASADLTDDDGTLVLQSQDYGSRQFVEVTVLSGSFSTFDTDGDISSRDSGADIDVNINGQQAQGDGLRASVRTASLDASLNFASDNNVDDETATITITGGGSLFQIGQEVSTAGQVGLGIEAINTARLGGVSGKLFELGTGGGKSLLDVGPNVSGAELVSIIEDSLTRVSTLRGRLGAVQQNVIETNISTLGIALENISEARSEIIDTDFAVETANLTRGQILSQAGISTLAIANQMPQQVLALLG